MQNSYILLGVYIQFAEKVWLNIVSTNQFLTHFRYSVNWSSPKFAWLMTGEFRLSHHHKNIFLLLETSQLLAVAHNNVTYLLHLSYVNVPVAASSQIFFRSFFVCFFFRDNVTRNKQDKYLSILIVYYKLLIMSVNHTGAWDGEYL